MGSAIGEGAGSLGGDGSADGDGDGDGDEVCGSEGDSCWPVKKVGEASELTSANKKNRSSKTLKLFLKRILKSRRLVHFQSLCKLCVLCVSAIKWAQKWVTAETQRTHELGREESIDEIKTVVFPIVTLQSY